MGAGRGHKLVDSFGGIDKALPASLTELEALACRQLPRRASLWASRWNWQMLSMTSAREAGAEVIVAGRCRVSPKRLLEIYDPPLVLVPKGMLGSH